MNEFPVKIIEGDNQLRETLNRWTSLINPQNSLQSQTDEPRQNFCTINYQVINEAKNAQDIPKNLYGKSALCLCIDTNSSSPPSLCLCSPLCNSLHNSLKTYLFSNNCPTKQYLPDEIAMFIMIDLYLGETFSTLKQFFEAVFTSRHNCLGIVAEVSNRILDQIEELGGRLIDKRCETTLVLWLKEDHITPLTINQATVKDFDEFTKFVETSSIAEGTKYGQYALAELIEQQTQETKVLVASYNGETIGLAVVSSEVDLQFYRANYSLDMYDYLLTDDYADLLHDDASTTIVRKGESVTKPKIKRKALDNIFSALDAEAVAKTLTAGRLENAEIEATRTSVTTSEQDDTGNQVSTILRDGAESLSFDAEAFHQLVRSTLLGPKVYKFPALHVLQEKQKHISDLAPAFLTLCGLLPDNETAASQSCSKENLGEGLKKLTDKTNAMNWQKMLGILNLIYSIPEILEEPDDASLSRDYQEFNCAKLTDRLRIFLSLDSEKRQAIGTSLKNFDLSSSMLSAGDSSENADRELPRAFLLERLKIQFDPNEIIGILLALFFWGWVSLQNEVINIQELRHGIAHLVRSRTTHLQNHILQAEKNELPDHTKNCYRLVYIALKDGWRQRALDVVVGTFEYFPSKDYCLFDSDTLHHFPTNELLLVKQKNPGGQRFEPLYLLHRSKLLFGLSIEIMKPGHIQDVLQLMAFGSQTLFSNKKQRVFSFLDNIQILQKTLPHDHLLEEFFVTLFSTEVSAKKTNVTKTAQELLSNAISDGRVQEWLETILEPLLVVKVAGQIVGFVELQEVPFYCTSRANSKIIIDDKCNRWIELLRKSLRDGNRNEEEWDLHTTNQLAYLQKFILENHKEFLTIYRHYKLPLEQEDDYSHPPVLERPSWEKLKRRGSSCDAHNKRSLDEKIAFFAHHCSQRFQQLTNARRAMFVKDCVLNPVFHDRTKLLLQRILSMFGKKRLFTKNELKHEISAALIGSFTEVERRVVARFYTSDSQLQKQPNYLLGMFRSHTLYKIPRVVSKTVVVVGDSQAGRTALRNLLSMSNLNFVNLFLVKPSPCSKQSFLPTDLTQETFFNGPTALDMRITVVEARMCGIDTHNKLIGVTEPHHFSMTAEYVCDWNNGIMKSIKDKQLEAFPKFRVISCASSDSDAVAGAGEHGTFSFNDNAFKPRSRFSSRSSAKRFRRGIPKSKINYLHYDYLLLSPGVSDYSLILRPPTIKRACAVVDAGVSDRLPSDSDKGKRISTFQEDTNQDESAEDSQPKNNASGKTAERYKFLSGSPLNVFGVTSIADPYLPLIYAENGLLISSLIWNPCQRIVVYGAGIDALSAVQALLRRRVPSSKITLVRHRVTCYQESTVDEQAVCRGCPSRPLQTELDNKILKMMETMGIKIYVDYKLESIIVDEEYALKKIYIERVLPCHVGENSQQPTSRPSSQGIELPATFLLTAVQHRTGDPDILSTLSTAGVVVHGDRVIVDGAYKTACAGLYATGPISAFSSTVRDKKFHAWLTPSSVAGRLAAEAIATDIQKEEGQILLSSYGTESEEKIENRQMLVGLEAQLPGNLYYLVIEGVGLDDDTPDTVISNDVLFFRMKKNAKSEKAENGDANTEDAKGDDAKSNKENSNLEENEYSKSTEEEGENERKKDTPITQTSRHLLPTSMLSQLEIKGYWFALTIDSNGFIKTIQYAGTRRLNALGLTNLIGMHEHVLNTYGWKRKVARNKLMDFLNGKWARVLFLSEFKNFYKELDTVECQQDDKGEARKQIDSSLIQFVKQNAIHLWHSTPEYLSFSIKS